MSGSEAPEAAAAEPAVAAEAVAAEPAAAAREGTAEKQGCAASTDSRSDRTNFSLFLVCVALTYIPVGGLC